MYLKNRSMVHRTKLRITYISCYVTSLSKDRKELNTEVVQSHTQTDRQADAGTEQGDSLLAAMSVSVSFFSLINLVTIDFILLLFILMYYLSADTLYDIY